MVATDKPPRPHQPHQIARQQRDAGALDRDVGAAAHRDADIGGSKRRRIVDAVADHGDATALLPQPLDHLAFAFGQYARLDLVDAERVRHRARGGDVVAGQHHHAQAVAAQRLQARLAPTA